jgi:hypothetical protein
MIYDLLLAIFLFIQPDFYKHDRKPVVASEVLKEWVFYLASDDMRGRSNGSPEMKTAACWIAENFKESGLKSFNRNNNFIQEYNFSYQDREIHERNVIGYIEGSDPILKDEYIIVSSHFDHIGVKNGSVGDSIFNGADDNASGTATLMAIARSIMYSGARPSRTIIFAAFSGEEYGMKGSRYFVKHSPVPYEKIKVNLNFEMTGHSKHLGKRRFYMTGCSKSNLDEIISRYNENTGFRLIDTIPLAEIYFTASDNISFSRIAVRNGKVMGIPSGTFATAVLPEYLHMPSDEAGSFDFDHMAEFVNHFSKLIMWLSASEEEIMWTSPEYFKP